MVKNNYIMDKKSLEGRRHWFVNMSWKTLKDFVMITDVSNIALSNNQSMNEHIYK